MLTKTDGQAPILEVGEPIPEEIPVDDRRSLIAKAYNLTSQKQSKKHENTIGQDENPDKKTAYYSILQNHFDLTGSLDSKGCIRTVKVIQTFLEKPQLLKIHDFDAANCILCFNEIDTRYPNKLTEEEFMRVIQEPRVEIDVDEINRFFTKNPLSSSDDTFTYHCLLPEDMVSLLQEKVDDYSNRFLNGDDRANISRFIGMLLTDEDNYDLLSTYTIYILPLNRLLTLSQILTEYDLYLKYFYDRNCHKFDSFMDILFKYQLQPDLYFSYFIPSFGESDDRNLVNLELKENLRRVFEESSNGSPIAEKEDLIEKMKNDLYFQPLMDEIVRKRSSKL